jgi:hypothetical protein
MPTSQPVGASAPVKPATTTYSGETAYKMYWPEGGLKTLVSTIFRRSSDSYNCVLVDKCTGDTLLFSGKATVIYNGKVVLSSLGNEIVSEYEGSTFPVRSHDWVAIKWQAGDSRNFQIVIPGDATSADQVLNLTF